MRRAVDWKFGDWLAVVAMSGETEFEVAGHRRDDDRGRRHWLCALSNREEERFDRWLLDHTL